MHGFKPHRKAGTDAAAMIGSRCIHKIVCNAGSGIDYQAISIREKLPGTTNACQPVHAQGCGGGISVFYWQGKGMIQHKFLFEMLCPTGDQGSIHCYRTDDDMIGGKV